MRPHRLTDATRILLLAAVAAAALLTGCATKSADPERIRHHRNLGKAFYENPTTHAEAVAEFRKALDLAPDSARERVNYGLALLRAGKTAEGIAELENAQQQDPEIPHTWFNLGIAYKREGDYGRAIEQFERMVEIVPDEAVSHYNLGFLYKAEGRQEDARRMFERASFLDPNLAGPWYQLYVAHRQAGRADEAARVLAVFQEVKKRQEGAAVPEDLDWSYYSEIYETLEPKPEKEPPGEVRFLEQSLAAGLADPTAGLAILDANGDGRPDLIAWSGDGVRLFLGGTAPPAGPLIPEAVLWVAPGDFDNDGLADLCVVTAAGAALYGNREGSFRREPIALPEGVWSRALWIDYDHDYDVDLLLLGEKSVLLRNEGEAGFADRSSDFPFAAGRVLDAAQLDWVADTNAKDLVVAYADRSAVLYRDRLAGRYDAVPLDFLPAGVRSIAAHDFDGDGWTDLAAADAAGVRLIANRAGKWEALAELPGASGPLAFADLGNRALADLFAGNALYRNEGEGRLTRRAPYQPEETIAAVAADFNLDGRVDLAVVTTGGELRLLWNESPAARNWLGVSLAGVKNLKLAPGAHVEVKAGSYYRKQIYRGAPLHFGVREYAEVDTVRVMWPNGLIQNLPRESVNRLLAVTEAPRLTGSCPMIFTWNGREFEFITDVLGVAPLGASSGDGEYFPVDHDEYVQIPAKALAVRDGHYEVRITEELREVSYLDQVQLIAVDHPASLEIFTNDKFKGPPFPEFRLFGVSRRIAPSVARDHRGRDVLDRVRVRDRAYPDAFRRDYANLAELHSVELDFGKAAPDNRGVLVMHGWVDWPDGSTFLGVAQEGGAGLIFPYLQVRDRHGNWQTVIEDMGIPAGKPKTIVVDLTGKFLSASRAVRIVTNLCVYWDEIFLSEDTEAPESLLTRLNPAAADLRFRGFSTPVVHPRRLQPEAFDYARWMPLSMWNPTPGSYTRYGGVLPLLQAIDDRLVIMGSGDELRLLFPAAELPPVRKGWRRDFLLFVDGWAKDGDANTAFSQAVEPLPFHGMSQYPYPAGEKYPDTEEHKLYRQLYNTRPALRLIRPLAGTGR